MRAPRRIPLSHCAIVVLLVAVFSSATLAQNSGAPSQPAQPAQTAPAAQAQLPAKWNEAVRALAEKIAGATGSPRRISLDVRNISSLDSSATSLIRQAIQSELAANGFKLGAGGLRVRVTLSEGTDGYIWVAEIEQGDAVQVAAVSLSRSTNSDTSLHAAPVLQKRTVWEQADPFLDFSEKTRPVMRVLSVLERDRIENYAGVAGRFNHFLRGGIILVDHGSRDLRGRLVARDNGDLNVFVATTVCVTSLVLYCVDSPEQEWPVGDGWNSHYAPGQNYFTGLSEDWVTIEGDPRPFFAVSRLEYDHGSDWIQTELDGKARLFKFSTKPVAAFSGWGDDIATVKPGCGGSWHVLVTGTGDWTQTDYVQLYEIDNDQPKPIGQRLEFAGPIFAMWSSDDKKSARVVSKNLQTGMYEASIVSVSCSD